MVGDSGRHSRAKRCQPRPNLLEPRRRRATLHASCGNRAPPHRFLLARDRSLVRLFDPIPWRTIPPNAITAASMALALASIHCALAEKDYSTAAWFILISVLLDKLDGSVARFVRGSSEFGVQFDSFSDATAFGLAPAALIYGMATTYTPQVWGPGATVLGLAAPAVLAGICSIYGVMTAIRLARFNVTTASIGPSLFLGLPSTLSGAMIASAYMAIGELGFDKSHPQILAMFPWLAVVNAALMVCNLPLPKLKTSSHPVLKTIQLILATGVFVAVPLKTGMPLLFALVLGYLVLGFGWLGPRMYAQRTDLQAAHG